MDQILVVSSTRSLLWYMYAVEAWNLLFILTHILLTLKVLYTGCFLDLNSGLLVQLHFSPHWAESLMRNWLSSDGQ
jgi:hypothetical protein